MHKIDLGKVIRTARQQKNLTMIELAEQINITQGYLSKIENNVKTPKILVLKEISRTLDIPLGDLLVGAGYLDEFREMLRENTSNPMPPNPPSFGGALKRMRNADTDKELSLSHIANKLNLDESYLKQIENDEKFPSDVYQIKEISKAYDCAFAYLYFLSNQSKKTIQFEIPDELIARLEVISYHSLSKIDSMTFDEFYKRELNKNPYMSKEIAQRLHTEYLAAKQIDNLARQLAGIFDLTSLIDGEHFLTPAFYFEYNDHRLSQNDLSKLRSKIKELVDEFEYLN